MSYAFARNATRPLRAWAALMPVFGAALAMAAIGAAAAAPAPTVDLDISKFAFVPKEVTIAPGTTIVWINRDETPHTVTSNNKSFASKGLDTGDKFEHTFASEGDSVHDRRRACTQAISRARWRSGGKDGVFVQPSRTLVVFGRTPDSMLRLSGTR